MPARLRLTIQKDLAALQRLLPEIQALADSEKEALGFLPTAALGDAILRQRLFAATVESSGASELAGYLLYGGIFPHAKIQQIAVARNLRKSGVASALMKVFASDLERVGFMTIKADVASDLPSALAFYVSNGFEFIRQRAGGHARGRMINIHVRQLETDSLFSTEENLTSPSPDLGIRRRSAGDTPFFAFDLNVYFDLVRDRNHSDQARRLFAAALGHDVRLAVADEFVTELRRTSNGAASDPILQMAFQLPRLPKINRSEIDEMAARIHELVFVKRQARGAGSKQALSDCQHLAHAVLSRASAFVTRDGTLLSARNELLSTIGIDVAEPGELVALLPSEASDDGTGHVQGQGFSGLAITGSQLLAYLADVGVSAAFASEFCSDDINSSFVRREAISEEGRIVAVGALKVPKGMEPVARLLVHVRSDHVDCDMFADYLLDKFVKLACRDAAISVELVHFAGQSSVNSLAKARGFFRSGNSTNYTKIAVGRPATSHNWTSLAQSVRRRTGLVLPEHAPAARDGGYELNVQTPAGQTVRIGVSKLEDLLSPTIVVWPGRDGVVVPIARSYADDLLGTSQQSNFTFIENRDAAFLSRRGYVNSPRAAKHMRPDRPILFYESKRKGGGRGAVVAVARIVDSVIIQKRDVPKDGHRRLVVDSVDAFSASDDVLLTMFDNLFVLPTPVPFSKLKEIDAIGSANLISAVSLSSEKITEILTQGWSSGKV